MLIKLQENTNSDDYLQRLWFIVEEQQKILGKEEEHIIKLLPKDFNINETLEKILDYLGAIQISSSLKYCFQPDRLQCFQYLGYLLKNSVEFLLSTFFFKMIFFLCKTLIRS